MTVVKIESFDLIPHSYLLLSQIYFQSIAFIWFVVIFTPRKLQTLEKVIEVDFKVQSSYGRKLMNSTFQVLKILHINLSKIYVRFCAIKQTETLGVDINLLSQ